MEKFTIFYSESLSWASSYNPQFDYQTRCGEDVVKCNIRCTGKSGVIYDSLNPNSLSKIRDLETGKNCFNELFDTVKAA